MRKNRLAEDLRSFLCRYLPSERGLSGNTIRSYRDSFRLFFRHLSKALGKPQSELCYSDLTAKSIASFLDGLESASGCSVSTRNQRLAAISSFAKYAASYSVDGLSFFSEVAKVPQKKAGQRRISFFTGEEVEAILATFDRKTAIGLRNYAMVSFMYASGARAQEVCDLRVRDIAFKQDGKASVEIVGKGRKRRRVSINKNTASVLRRYLTKNGAIRDPMRNVFESQGGRVMKISCIEEVFKKAIKSAKARKPSLFKGHYTPHSMRHTTATHMLKAGVPLIVIKNVLGHASLETTQIYAEITNEVAEKYLKEFRSLNGGEKIPLKGEADLDFLQ